MARPATLTDDERMLPYAVSLDRARREAFKALGGSAWLREAIDHATRGLYFPSATLAVASIDRRAGSVTLQDRSSGCLLGPYHVGDAFPVDLVTPILPSVVAPKTKRRA